jgi:pimeloyl-ACP methyl ester carboxylesterase
VVSAGGDGTLRLWDSKTGEQLRTLSGHTGSVTACAVTPDGRFVVSASRDHTLRLWDAVSADEVVALAVAGDLLYVAATRRCRTSRAVPPEAPSTSSTWSASNTKLSWSPLSMTATCCTFVARAVGRNHSGEWPQPSGVPTGIAVFAEDIAIRRYAEQSNEIVHWSEFDRGGHFAAMEAPDLLIEDVRDFFRQLRVTREPRCRPPAQDHPSPGPVAGAAGVEKLQAADELVRKYLCGHQPA